jgi:hypothetical protein
VGQSVWMYGRMEDIHPGTCLSSSRGSLGQAELERRYIAETRLRRLTAVVQFSFLLHHPHFGDEPLAPVLYQEWKRSEKSIPQLHVQLLLLFLAQRQEENR